MQKKVPFLDLRIIDKKERGEMLSVIRKIFLHGRIVLGPEVSDFENKIAKYCDRKYGIGVNSGTDALFLGLKSLGIGPGDEVITTSLSWIATTNAIALTGATPVFADIKNDLNIDPNSVDKLITKRTKAILPVHYTGRICEMDSLIKVAKKHRLFLVEDAAQAFGASYKGKKAGSFGEIACFSMNPMKVLAACGEAGIVVTDRDDIRDRMISLRYNGTVNREKCIEPSLNGRMDTLQAGILLYRLKKVEKIIKERRRIAGWYNEQLKGIVETPVEFPEQSDAYYTYTIRAESRDELKEFLERKGIQTKIQHPYLMPQQPAYRKNAKGEYPNAEKLVKKVLCVPANEKITKKDVEYVANTIKNFYKGK